MHATRNMQNIITAARSTYGRSFGSIGHYCLSANTLVKILATILPEMLDKILAKVGQNSGQDLDPLHHETKQNKTNRNGDCCARWQVLVSWQVFGCLGSKTYHIWQVFTAVHVCGIFAAYL